MYFSIAYINSFDEGNLWLIPPFGASMVLVIAVNESPLAHPKMFWAHHICFCRSFCICNIRFFLSECWV